MMVEFCSTMSGFETLLPRDWCELPCDTTSLLPSLYSYAVPIYRVSARTVNEASDLRLADQPIGQSSVEIRPLLLKSVLKQRKQEEEGQESKCED